MNSIKRISAIIPAASALLSLSVATLSAQETSPTPQTKSTPAAPTAAEGENPQPSAKEKFPSEKAFQSYALGSYFGANNRYFFRGKELDVADLKEGLKEVFEAASTNQDFSRAVGVSVALQIAHRGAEIDVDSLLEGLTDALTYKEVKLNSQEQRQAMSDVEAALKTKREEEVKASAPENEAKGAAFLAQNKARDGVAATPSGLQYEVITEGQGDKPGSEDTVQVHYLGTRLDGSVFDRTEPGTPKKISLKSRYIIPGWKEGMQLMSPGAKYKFYIPHDLAYGMDPRNTAIGGNETLIMEVELVSSEPPRQAATPRQTRPGASAVTPPVRVPLPNNKGEGRATAVTPPVKVEFPPAGGKDAKRGTRVTPPVKVEFPPKKKEEKKDAGEPKE